MADSKTSGGIGLGWLIFFILLILKATGNIAMGWFWVITSFIWAPIAVVGIILGIIFVIGLIGSILGM